MGDDEKLIPVRPRAPHRTSREAYSVVDVERADFDTLSYLRDYWDVLMRRRWAVITVAVMVTTLVVIFTFRMKPVYRATARVEVDAETPPVQNLNELSDVTPTDSAFLRTQVDVLESNNLAWQTIQGLNLEKNPAFYRSREPAPVSGLAQARLQDRLLRTFRRDLHVALANDSRMITVGFESTDPELASRVSNALVKHYLEYNFLTQYDATRQASGWMEQQLDELKHKVEQSQEALVNYEQAHSIVNISDKQNIVEQRLADLSSDLTVAENNLAEKQSVYELVQANPKQVALLAQDTLLQRLQEKYADLESQYVNALSQYGPNFPTVKQLESQVQVMRGLIEQERERTIGRTRNEYEVALNREKILAAEVTQEKSAVGRLNQLLIQHNILKHEFETNQELYDSLLKRLKNATVAAGLRATNVHIVDDAFVPAVPVRPKKLLNLAVGLMVGLILGVTLAFVREALDRSLKTPEALERSLAAPVLAVIPKATSLPGERGWKPWRKDGAGKQPEFTVTTQPDSGLAEAFRGLRTSVLLSSAPRAPQVILITSSQPNEGKTVTCLNLAQALAQLGKQVLLMDADLRRPGLSRLMGIAKEKGLSNVLTGSAEWEPCLVQMERLANLWVLPAGPQPPNPADLLASAAQKELLQNLRQRFEHVILDTPPIMMATEAVVLSPEVDGVILVAESGVTDREAVERSYRILDNARARILGGVLNKLDVQQDGYYTYYRYYNRYYRNGNGSGKTHSNPLSLTGPGNPPVAD